MKQVTSYIDVFDFTASRCILSALVLFIALLSRGHAVRPTPFKYALAIALLRIYGMIGLAQWASVNGSVGKVAILSYATPSWAVIFITLLLDECLRRGQYFVILIAAFSLFLVLQPQQLDSSSMRSTMLIVLSGVNWGASVIVARRLYARHPCVDLLSLTSWQMLHATLVINVVVLLVSQCKVDRQPTMFWALVYSTVPATALVWSSWLFVLENLSASIVSLSTLAILVCGILFSQWLLGKNPGVIEGSGAALIVLTLTLVSRKKKEAVSTKSV